MKTRRSGFDVMSPYIYPFYILFHPADGFQEMKINKKSSPKLAFFVLFLWMVSEVFKRVVTDYDFNAFADTKFDISNVFVITIFSFALFVISNWCFCTLLDGKGKLLDIIVVGAYALIPYIIVKIAVTMLSFITDAEAGAQIFNILNTLSIVWGCCVVFIGLMVMHDYTFPMTCASVLLTFIGAIIAFFIALLITTLFQQFVDFINAVYTEVKYR